ncbi:MAG: leucyl aminopeptidase [Saprospiraceae bacterium]|nr:leucyl aminopeptidase [Saprospiraceae bacterium]
MTIHITEHNPPDNIVVPLLQNEALADHLSDLAIRSGQLASALQQDFRADAKETLLLYAQSAGPRFYLLGLGKKSAVPDLQNALRGFCHRNKSKLPLHLGVDLRHFPLADIPRLTDAAVAGMLLGLYDLGLYRTPDPAKPAPQFGSDKASLTILVPGAVLPESRKAAQRGETLARATLTILNFVNAAGNKKIPAQLAEWVRAAGEQAGFTVRILQEEAIRNEKLELLWQVGKGSPHPPALIVLDYSPKKAAKNTPLIGLVGKGVTFDPGGVSLKPSANMHLMKSDMGGAAAVVGTFIAAAQLKLPVRLFGVIPAAENMIDGSALKPGDVVDSHAGKTIEVTDTDAEGRLILADAISWLLQQQSPEVLIDLATLTGSVIRALGYQAAGLFTANDDLADALARAGEASGERLWRMPLWDEYGADLKSDVADLRNYTGKPVAESISAAKFIEHFTASHPAWAHLDIAGTAFGDSEFAQSKSATGFGVRLLVEFVERWIGPRP